MRSKTIKYLKYQHPKIIVDWINPQQYGLVQSSDTLRNDHNALKKRKGACLVETPLEIIIIS